MEQISQAESIALVVEFPNVESYTNKLFKSFYRITDKRREIGVEVEYNLAKILSTLTSELEVLPSDTVDIILEKFLSKPPKTLQGDNAGSLPTESLSFQISKAICIDNVDIMTRHVNQYFADIISSITTHVDEEEPTKKPGKRGKPTEAKRAETKRDKQEKLLILAEQIWISVPELLSSIMGQLEQGLSVEEDVFRELTVRSIGKMISVIPSRVSFVKDHFATWKAWMGRVIDKSAAIRIAWVQSTPAIITNRTDIVTEVAKNLSDKLSDPDEKVRIAACAAIGELSVDTIAAKLDKSFSFDVLFERLRDKKPQVRQEAFKVVGKLYKNAYPQIEKGDSVYIKLFAQIPQKVFDQVYLNDKEVNELIDICLNSYIFASESDDMGRATRLLTIITHLEENGRSAFNAIIKRQFTLSKYLALIVSMIKDKNADRSQLNNIIKYIGATFADNSRAESLLVDIVEGKNDQQHVQKYLPAAINPESNYNTVTKSIKSILTKEHDKLYHHTAQILLYRTAFLILNRSTIIPIVEISRESSNKLTSTAHELLKSISESQPALMRNHVSDLIIAIESGEVGTQSNTDTLKATNLLADRFPEMIPQTLKFFKTLVRFATEGSVGEAIEVIKLISFSDNKNKYFEEVAKHVVNLNKENPLLATYLAAISELYKRAPAIPERDSRQIFRFISELLSDTKREGTPNDPEWVDDKDFDIEGQAKVLTLGIYVNRLMKAIKDTKEIESFARVVFTLLASIIGNVGELVRTDKVSPEFYKSRLRLEAGLQFLTLATSRTTQRLIRPQEVTKLAYIVQDSALEVRKRFIHKLLQYWSSMMIPNRFLPLVFMTAFEKNRDMYHYVSTWIRARAERNHIRAKEDPSNKEPDLMALEFSLPAFIHMIVHHHHNIEDEEKDRGPDSLPSIAAAAKLSTSRQPADDSETPDSAEKGRNGSGNKETDGKGLPRSLIIVARYILFYLSTVASEQNVSVIYHMSGRVKYFQDHVDESLSPQLYLVSEAAQVIIKKYQELRGWQLSAWPGSAGVPSELFKTMPSALGKQVQNTIYFPEIYKKDMDEYVKKQVNKIRKQNGDLEPERDAHAPEGENGETNGRSRSKRKSTGGAGGSAGSTKRRKTIGAAKQVSYRTKKTKSKKDSQDDDEASENGDNNAEPSRRSTRIADSGKSVNYYRDADLEEVEESESESESDSESDDELSSDENDTNKNDITELLSDSSSDLSDAPDIDEDEEMKELDEKVEKILEESNKEASDPKKPQRGRKPRKVSATALKSTPVKEISASTRAKPQRAPRNGKAKGNGKAQKEESERKLVESDDDQLSELSYDSDIAAEADSFMV